MGLGAPDEEEDEDDEKKTARPPPPMIMDLDDEDGYDSGDPAVEELTDGCMEDIIVVVDVDVEEGRRDR